MKIVTAEEMRRIDHNCSSSVLPASLLMENAGSGAAEEAKRILGDLTRQNILFLIGPGNNGGDGLVAARCLRDWGAWVCVYLLAKRKNDSNLDRIHQRQIPCFYASEDTEYGELQQLLRETSCVVDSLLGTGRLRPLEGVYKDTLDIVSARKKKRGFQVIAMDLPTGMDATTGEADEACLKADYSITLAFPKTGLFKFPGAELVGRLSVVDIGIPPHMADDITNELVTADMAAQLLPKRPLIANKGNFGKALVAAGSLNYIGAAYLACNGAMRVGAGLVTLATPASLLPILASRLTESTYLPLPETEPGTISLQAAEVLGKQFPNYQSLLLGCGLGQKGATMKFITAAFLQPGIPPLVVDADGLNTLARIPNWWQDLRRDAVLTPHPGEMARLCDTTIEEIQADREGFTVRKAVEWQKTIVLKGAFTVIASPEGCCRISPFANPGLATAGTGDVLSGVIAGLLAQKLSLFDAASLGVYLHGMTAERVRDTMGDSGMLAGDILPELPRAIKILKEKY